MTNYWETNFEAEMGGFYEFEYSITSGKILNHRNKLKELNLGTECFRLKND